MSRVPDLPSPGRRRLLAGLASGAVALAGGGGTFVLGRRDPTALPDPVTDVWTNDFAPSPDGRTDWHPTVTADHAREAVELLEATQREFERLQERTDEDVMGGGDGRLASARRELDAGNHHRALREATVGLQYAGQGVGTARAVLEEFDLEPLRRRAERADERATAVADSLDPYPVVDPERDLAWYALVEREARLGQHAPGFPGFAGASDDDVDEEYREFLAGQLTAGVFVGRLHAENAARFRDRLAERVDGTATTAGEDLERIGDRLRADLTPVSSFQEVRDRYVGDRDPDASPYTFAHRELALLCYPMSGPNPLSADVGRDLPVLRAIAFAQLLARVRGHDPAVDDLLVEPGDDGFDSGHALAEKRRAMETYRDVLGADPSPLSSVLFSPAVGRLRVATVDAHDGEDVPMWQARLSAYCNALVARTTLPEFRALYERLVGVS